MAQSVYLVCNNAMSGTRFNTHQMSPDIYTLGTLILVAIIM